MSSSSSDDENAWLMEQEDWRVSVEGILERLVRALVDEEYGDAEYWEERYRAEDGEYEWFLPWGEAVKDLGKYLSGAHVALNLGCGNSPMSQEMLDSGIEKVVSVDISQTVIQQMRKKYEGNEKLEWEVMDCTDLKYPDQTFDLVVDKGTLDALYCSDSAKDVIPKTLSEIQRVLKPGGVFIDISFGSPQTRTQLTESTALSFIEVVEIPNPKAQAKFNYAYVLQR